jgi:hypothetical protein
MSGPYSSSVVSHSILLPNSKTFPKNCQNRFLIPLRSVLGSGLFFVLLLFFPICAFPADVTLAWNPNTESDLAGYRIHYGTASGSYSVQIDVHNVTTCTVTGLTAGQTYHFAATAYDTSGNESGYSNQVSYQVPTGTSGVPSTPTSPSGGSTTSPSGGSAGSSSYPAATANQAPMRPRTPSGPSSASVNVSATFSTSSSDPNGDSLQYRYDWGGGVLSSWGAASQAHSWMAAGQYAVRAQARDSQGGESAWSRAKTVTIQAAIAGQVSSLDTDGDGVPDSQDAFLDDPKEWADANGNGIGDNADAAAGQNNPAPEAPLLTSPLNDSVVSVVPVLQTDSFRSPVAGTTHANTRWQVFREEDDVCLLDIKSTTALTSFTVPKLVLDEGTPFFWRAQFTDSNGAVSGWSEYEYFSTQTTETDMNANGILDAQEVPSTADLNKDGMPDAQQAVIKSVKMEGTTAQTGVSIQDDSTAIAIESVESEDARQPDLYVNNKPESMPFGILNIKIAVAKPGDQAAVKLYFLEPAPPAGKWYEYDMATERWIDFSSYTEFANDRLSAMITLRDGGPGDADGVANGIIIDPGGIGLADDGSNNGSGSGTEGISGNLRGDGSAGSGGGGGGCFIATSSERAQLDRMLFCLSLLALAAAIFRFLQKIFARRDSTTQTRPMDLLQASVRRKANAGGR